MNICAVFEHLLAPHRCLLCGGGCRQALCPGCLAQLPQAPKNGEWLEDGLQVQALWSYQPPADTAVLSFKYGGGESLARLWAQQMAPRVDGQPVLLPMPMHRSRLRERGGNPVEVMATALQQALTERVALLRAVRTRATPPQQGLSREARLRNVDGAFRVPARLQQRPVLLIDDVLTTGASLRALAAAARAAGAGRIEAVVMARALP